MNRSTAIRSILSLSLLTLAACGQKPAGGPPPAAAPPEVSVVTIAPTKASLTVELPGRVVPRRIAEVRPQVGGIIQKQLFTEGSVVKEGDLLYRIDPSRYEAVLATARAQEAKAEAAVSLARLKAVRYRDLIKTKSVSQQDLDDVEAALRLAEADLQGARAAVAAARIDLDRTRVTAPISGRIGRSSVTEGALVTANQSSPLATIQQIDTVYVDLTQSATDLLRMKREQGGKSGMIGIVLEDGTPYPERGTIRFSEITVDPGTGSVTLRAVVPNPKGVLLPGMFVRGWVEEKSIPDAILVPQRAVTRTPKGDPMVFVVGKEEKVEPRPIRAGRTIQDSWLVEEGLRPGDRVIVEGIQKARPGTVVKSLPYGQAPAGQQGGAPSRPAPAGK
ncbi:MAG: efflux RND transporter periplasmic adaptor subunit [Desulfuromonadia bacterium]